MMNLEQAAETLLANSGNLKEAVSVILKDGLRYEVRPHSRLFFGLQCKPRGSDRNWSGIPNMRSADDAELWLTLKGRAYFAADSVGTADSPLWSVTCSVPGKSSYGQGEAEHKTLGVAMWAAFARVMA